MAKWLCENCGFVIDETDGHKVCPKCQTVIPQIVSLATEEFNSKTMEDRADKLTDILIDTFGYSNTYLLLDYARLLTEQKQLKHYGVKAETESED